MYAAQITRTFIQPTDTHIVADALRGLRLQPETDMTSPAAFSVLRDMTDTWCLPTAREKRSVFPIPTSLPGLLDTAHVVDAVRGDEAFFVALHTSTNTFEVTNPFLFLGLGHVLSETRMLVATDTRRGAAGPVGSSLASLVQRITGERAGARIARCDLVGGSPVTWQGRRDLFAYDDTVAPDDPAWKQRPLLPGTDIGFDMVAARPLVSTVEVTAPLSSERAG